MSADLQDSIKIVTCLEDIAGTNFLREGTQGLQGQWRSSVGRWNKSVETLSGLERRVLPKVRDLLVVGEASVGAGKEKGVVVWSLGPPQLTTQASIVSKLFSFPVKVLMRRISLLVLELTLTSSEDK